MGIRNALRRLFNLRVTDPKAWDSSLWRFRGSESPSGEHVDEYTALNYSAVWNATALISGTISTLPLHLKQKAERKTTLLTDQKLYRVMHDRANPYMTAMQLRELMSAHVLLWGNGYAEIVRNGYGDVLALWPITPNRVKIKLENSEIVYEIDVDTEKITLPRRKILHISGLGFDGYQGYSVISMARKSIGLGMAMETFGSKFFSNGMNPGNVLTHPGKMSEEAQERFGKSMKKQAGGLENSHRMLILEEGMKFDKYTINPEDSQFMESRLFQIPEIARWFNLPPHKLKDLTKSSFNNIESEQISFVTDSILPWLIRFEQTYNMQLLTEVEQFNKNFYFKHNVEGLLRGNSKDRAEFYKAMWGIGAMSINDIREKEDMDPIDGGDEYFVQLNMAPLSRVNELIDEKMIDASNPGQVEAPPTNNMKKLLSLVKEK